MSTRCNVIIRSVDHLGNPIKHPIILYHHHDGYPSVYGVGPSLVKLTTLMQKHLGNNNGAIKLVNFLLKQYSSIMEYDFRGDATQINYYVMFDDEYVLTENLHGDIDYLYVVTVKHNEDNSFDSYNVDCYSMRSYDRDNFSKYIDPFANGEMPLDEYIAFLDMSNKNIAIEEWKSTLSQNEDGSYICYDEDNVRSYKKKARIPEKNSLVKIYGI